MLWRDGFQWCFFWSNEVRQKIVRHGKWLYPLWDINLCSYRPGLKIWFKFCGNSLIFTFVDQHPLLSSASWKHLKFYTSHSPLLTPPQGTSTFKSCKDDNLLSLFERQKRRLRLLSMQHKISLLNSHSLLHNIFNELLINDYGIYLSSDEWNLKKYESMPSIVTDEYVVNPHRYNGTLRGQIVRLITQSGNKIATNSTAHKKYCYSIVDHAFFLSTQNCSIIITSSRFELQTHLEHWIKFSLKEMQCKNANN